MELKDLEEMFKMEQELDIPHRDRCYNKDFDKRELEAEQSVKNCNIPHVSFSEERAEVCEIDGCDLRPYGDLRVCKHHFLEQIDKKT